VAQLLAEPEIEGVLVGGASLEPEGWAEICRAERFD
jgi:triosephosphate isomerase